MILILNGNAKKKIKLYRKYSKQHRMRYILTISVLGWSSRKKCELMSDLSYVMIPCPGKKERQKMEKRGKEGKRGKESEKDRRRKQKKQK